jgi:hypothetical protein
MADHRYDLASPEDQDDFRRVLADALAETAARNMTPRLYKAGDGSIEPVNARELADIVLLALRREVNGENYYSRRAAA